MNFDLSEEHQLIQDSVARFVTDNYELEARQALAATKQGFSSEHWQQMAELGWLGLTVPEGDGGFGGNQIDTMLGRKSQIPVEIHWVGIEIARIIELCRVHKDGQPNHVGTVPSGANQRQMPVVHVGAAAHSPPNVEAPEHKVRSFGTVVEHGAVFERQ